MLIMLFSPSIASSIANRHHPPSHVEIDDTAAGVRCAERHGGDMGLLIRGRQHNESFAASACCCCFTAWETTERERLRGRGEGEGGDKKEKPRKAAKRKGEGEGGDKGEKPRKAPSQLLQSGGWQRRVEDKGLRVGMSMDYSHPCHHILSPSPPRSPPGG
ncbi:hypothetical protein AHAS_Ahas12G0161900 [Arachis hypogaea]